MQDIMESKFLTYVSSRLPVYGDKSSTVGHGD